MSPVVLILISSTHHMHYVIPTAKSVWKPKNNFPYILLHIFLLDDATLRHAWVPFIDDAKISIYHTAVDCVWVCVCVFWHPNNYFFVDFSDNFTIVIVCGPFDANELMDRWGQLRFMTRRFQQPILPWHLIPFIAKIND